ncbi:MAG: hypothetical protein Q7U20_07845 [Caulobacter sp.]|nr:hypothetical protein [Caulobacter sp.]
MIGKFWMGRVLRAIPPVAAFALCAGAAMAAGTTPAGGDREGYGYAMKCYVANSLTANSFEKRGDAAKAQQYNANAKRSFDVAWKLGRALGLSDRTINADLDQTEANELPTMMLVAGRYRDAVARCKALGLM